MWPPMTRRFHDMPRKFVNWPVPHPASKMTAFSGICSSKAAGNMLRRALAARLSLESTSS
jgi:hypothetical protein